MTDNRILIMQPGLIGDVLLTLPLANLIKARLNAETVHLACPGEYGRFLEGCTVYDRVFDSVEWELDFLHDKLALYHFVAVGLLQTRLVGYTHVVCFCFDKFGTWASNFMSLCGSITPHSIHLLTFTPPDSWERHVTDWHLFQLSAELGFCPEDLDPWRSQRLIEPADQWRRDYIAEPNRPLFVLDSPYVLFVPGSGVGWKRWNLLNFIALADRLKEGSTRVAWLFGPAELDLASQFVTKHDVYHHPVYWSDRLSVSAWLCCQAQAVVTNDNAISHLSAGLGIPTLTLFGPTKSLWYRPCGPQVECIQFVKNEFNRESEASVCLTMQSLLKLTAECSKA